MHNKILSTPNRQNDFDMVVIYKHWLAGSPSEVLTFHEFRSSTSRLLYDKELILASAKKFKEDAVQAVMLQATSNAVSAQSEE